MVLAAPPLGDRTIDRAASLWRAGHDTVDIARELKVSEASVWRAMSTIRHQAKVWRLTHGR